MLLFKILLPIFLQFTFQTQLDCSQLPVHYKSYDEAIRIIKSADFKMVDDCNTSKSSWIRGASYYTCDGQYGFFILVTDSQEYIHANVPYSVWFGFKNASSFGTYYNDNLKHQYRFNL